MTMMLMLIPKRSLSPLLRHARFSLSLQPIITVKYKSSTAADVPSCASKHHNDDNWHRTKIQPKKEQLGGALPNFNDSLTAYKSKSTIDLLRSIAVLRLCRIPLLVQNAEMLLNLSYKIIGKTMTNHIVKKTLFKHFCGGTNEHTIRPVVSKLRNDNIGSILDYAAENDSSSNESKSTTTEEQKSQQPIIARVYDYESETRCDEHVQTFLSCIHAVKNVTPDGFAALKVTALGNPLLLEKLSLAVREIQRLFSTFDTNSDGTISREEFIAGYNEYFVDADVTLPRILQYLDEHNDNSNGIDYITWSKLLKLKDLPRITSQCRDKGPLAKATPTEEEIDLMEKMYQRAHLLAQVAFDNNVRLLIDAEQQKFQPAIDNLIYDLQRKYNSTNVTDNPIIFTTYQCYLKDAFERIKVDVERSKRYSYHFGTKLVRGAYMDYERTYSRKIKVESPIHSTIDDTHVSYNESAEYLLRQYNNKSAIKYEIMLATHNQCSIEKAIRVVNEMKKNKENISGNNNLLSSPSLTFAQLYGMADNLTWNLSENGFKSYKYVPYGEVDEVIPYLLRRAHENSSLMSNTSMELQLMKNEIKRRLRSTFSF